MLRQAKIILTTSAVQVEQTVAHEILTTLGGRAEIKRSPGLNAPAGSIRVAVVQERAKWGSIHPALDSPKEWMMVRAKNGGGIELLASRSHLLYYLYTILTENWKGLDIGKFSKGKIAHPTFKNLRPVYDLFLPQHARTVRNFNREEHVRNLARMGISHVEANGLAFAVPFERGPQGERNLVEPTKDAMGFPTIPLSVVGPGWRRTGNFRALFESIERAQQAPAG